MKEFIEATKEITWPAAFVVVSGIVCLTVGLCKIFTEDWPWDRR